MSQKKKARRNSSDSEDENDFEDIEFTQPGSIKRLKFFNFMQYTEVEFECGPNLNVIIGPNGSGKSTIVNGICLGLAGKPNVLGRSSNIADFIKVGEDQAIIEVELFHPEQDNVTIIRQFDKNGKSLWKINGKKAGVKEVEKKVQEFKIQVDNLCQFLPQDKVHDFSRLNSKGLLDSTVDAVGDLSLKEQHAKLKELQKSMSEGEELFERKRQMLHDNTEKCRRLEEEVKAFDEKKKLEEKVTVAEGRLAWCKFYETGKIWRQAKNKFDAAKLTYNEQERKINPIKNEIDSSKQKKASLEGKMQKLSNNIKEFTGKAKTHSQNIERLDDEIDRADDDIDRILRAEESRKNEIKQMKAAIAELEAELESTQDDENLAPLCDEARKKTEVLLRQQTEKSGELQNLKFERTGLNRQIQDRQEDIKKLNDVEKMKLEKLRQLNIDAAKATQYLRNNRNVFQNDVFEPFVMCANVHDLQFSKYLENAINPRDMTAFFFTSTDDMNNFLNIVRNQLGLKKVSAVVLPNKDISEFQAPASGNSLSKFGFISYLKDLVSAPESVLTYMCQFYHLHRIPVFKEEADKYSDKFINEIGFTKFFIGNKVQSVSGSLYSSVKSTLTREVFSNRMLEITKDEERERGIAHEIQQTEGRLRQIEDQIKTINSQYDSINLELEKARQEHRALDQRRNFKARQAALIENHRRDLRRKMAEAGSNNEKQEKEALKKTIVTQQVRSVQQLQKAISESNEIRLKMELFRLASQPLDEIIQRKTDEFNEAKENIKDLKRAVEDLEREYIMVRDTMKDLQREAVRITGQGARKEDPPEDVKKRWAEEKVPDGVDELNLFIQELKAQADCMESVDKRILRDYDELKETIEELEQDIARRESNMSARNRQMQELKNCWVENLSNLVSRINTNFSSHFASMGFAGEVALKTGSHEDDFENYGIIIRVKYRDNEPLQELTAHHQSGGERSVATALYMLALQELTTVPFRCVDEINQGMDARNERLVFELLVRTSCHVSSAQYFLLTPKLLTGLKYSPRMNLLIVYNGPLMCHYTEWNSLDFEC